MWVKGSGSDLATMGAEHFTGLRLDEVLPLIERDGDERRGHGRLPRALPARPGDAARLDRDAAARLRPGAARPPHASGRDQRARRARPTASASCASASATSAAWIPYIRPGFTLSTQVGEAARAEPRPQARRAGQARARRVGRQRRGGLPAHDRGHQPGGRVRQRAHRRRAALRRRATRRARPRPSARSCCTSCCPRSAARSRASAHKLLTVDTSARSVEFVSSAEAEQLVTVGAPCPDHLVHTKRAAAVDPLRPRHRRRRRAARADRRARRGVPRRLPRVRRGARRRDDRAGRPGPADRADPAPRARLDRHDDEERDASRATSTTARSR